MNDLRDFIASNPTDWLEILVEKFKIHVSVDGSLVSLKYNQVESPMEHPVVKQCRGAVVHVPTGTLLAHPYDKFWNFGEPQADEIDWSTARVMDKLDGSLMILYWDPFADRWRVASSGHPTAGGSYGSDPDETFSTAFWSIWSRTAMGMPEDHRALCFMFELCSPSNRIVCKYDRDQLVLHGARNITTGQELGPDALDAIASWHSWPSMLGTLYTMLGDRVEVIAAAAERDPTKYEGFVVCDAQFRRVKIKSPAYVRLHRLRDKTTPRAIIEAWKTGEIDEILAHFPEMRPDFERIICKLEAAAVKARGLLLAYGAHQRKEFADVVKHDPTQALCFRLYTAKDSSVEAALSVLRSMTTAALERIVEAMS